MIVHTKTGENTNETEFTKAEGTRPKIQDIDQAQQQVQTIWEIPWVWREGCRIRTSSQSPPGQSRRSLTRWMPPNTGARRCKSAYDVTDVEEPSSLKRTMWIRDRLARTRHTSGVSTSCRRDEDENNNATESATATADVTMGQCRARLNTLPALSERSPLGQGRRALIQQTNVP